MRAKTVFQTLAIVALSGAALSAASRVLGQESVSLTGCVERDAAAATPIYKLIVTQATGPSAIYQLNAPASANVAQAVGKTAQVGGSVSVEKRAGREIKVLNVKTFDVVAEGCKSPA